MEYLKEDDYTLAKILFTGLDCSGKTSIIYALQREFSKIANILPTKGAQRKIFNFLNHDIYNWDLGGQEKYRIAYLRSPEKYFDNTEIAIYVIDIQEKDRIYESISYLSDVIEQFVQLEIEPPIYIFFHKYDPILNEEVQGYVEDLIGIIKEKINTITNYKKFYYYNTSIYDLSTIIEIMSKIFLSLYPKAELIQETVKGFAAKFEAMGIEIIDDNSLIIGSYYENDLAKDVLNQSTPYFLSLNDSFQYAEIAKNIETDMFSKMIIERFGKYFLFTQFKVTEDSSPFYLLCIKSVPDFNKEEYLAFVNLLKDILHK